MRRRALIVCIDGLGPDYLESAPTPVIDQMVASGEMVMGTAVVPTVTNVNNVSIITGKLPRDHGITSNYWIDRTTGREMYMESVEFLCCKTVLQRAKSRGLKTALLTSKKKLLRLINTGSDYRLSAEKPDSDMVSRLGDAPGIYDPEINHWLFEALKIVVSEKRPDITYCSTTDGAMHKYAPDDERSIEHIAGLDRILGIIADENPDLDIYITADHGMSSKKIGIDLQKVFGKKGIKARSLPVIKDRYVAHHRNLGGAAYVFIERSESIFEAMSVLKETRGVEVVCSREEASERFGLMAERIGDILVLAEKDVVFGEFDSVEVDVSLRSHGSIHEQKIPIIGYPRLPRGCKMNMDIVGSIRF